MQYQIFIITSKIKTTILDSPIQIRLYIRFQGKAQYIRNLWIVFYNIGVSLLILDT